MRCKLINWLIEVVIHFRLHRATFYLAVYLVDRYLSLVRGVLRSELQLIGVAATFIAAKLEEIYPPNLKDFAEICDGSCPPPLIACKELDMMMVMRWHLNVASPFYWIGCYVRILEPYLPWGMDKVLLDASLELVDLAIHTPTSLHYSYSVLAAAALSIRLNQGLLPEPIIC